VSLGLGQTDELQLNVRDVRVSRISSAARSGGYVIIAIGTNNLERLMWKPIAEFEDVGPFRQFDLWLTVNPSPRSFGMGDAWRVPDAYYKDGKWWHVQNAESKELVSDYITHFMARPIGPDGSEFY
jgi:hypothetical protein